MAPVLEIYTAKTGETVTREYEGNMSFSTDRTGVNVIATPQMGWLPVNLGDEITYKPDNAGNVLVNRTPVRHLKIGRDSDTGGLFHGVYVIESRR
jgi:hypothetical protein